jgi:Leucine-rich repeat (LRR) protein
MFRNQNLRGISLITAIALVLTGCEKTSDTPEMQSGNIVLTVRPDNGQVQFYATAEQLFVDWGDGATATLINTTSITHTYVGNATYTVQISTVGLTAFGDGIPHHIDDDGKVVLDDEDDFIPFTGFMQTLQVNACNALKVLSAGMSGSAHGELAILEIDNCSALKMLICVGNTSLTSLDVSGCTVLTDLYCGFNQITSLDVSDCTALIDLDCGYNQITSLDVSGCTALTNLYCDGNQITSLDVSGCTVLTDLYCEWNQITSLDISGLTVLTDLDCSRNQLTTLNVSGCTVLTDLDCSRNQLTTLNVSDCTALTNLDCSHNQLTSLDISGLTALTDLDCYMNQLDVTPLNTIFAALPICTVNPSYGGQCSIDISVNPGAALGCNRTIAESKGWHVWG